MGIHSEMGSQSRSKCRSNTETSLPLRHKELLGGSAPSNSKKHSGETDIIHGSMASSHLFPQTAPVELPLHPLHVTSSLPPPVLAIADYSEEWDEQDEDDEEQFAFDFTVSVAVFNVRATDIAKLLGAYDPLEDGQDEEERFGEPLEAFHSSFYQLAGLRANGEEVSDVDSDEEESGDSSGDELDSEEDEHDQSEFGDDEVDSASFIGEDEEKEKWEEHDYSDADLDAEEDVSGSDDEETESEGEHERKRNDLHI